MEPYCKMLPTTTFASNSNYCLLLVNKLLQTFNHFKANSHLASKN